MRAGNAASRSLQATTAASVASFALFTFFRFDPINLNPNRVHCREQEIAASRSLQATTAASVISIAFFNFFGVSVTKRLSGAARCTIDACRTLFIWCVDLGL